MVGLLRDVPNVPLRLLARAELVVADGQVVKSRRARQDATMLVVDGKVVVFPSPGER